MQVKVLNKLSLNGSISEETIDGAEIIYENL